MMHDIKKYPIFDSTMFEEEIEAILAVLKDILSDFSGNGAFILTSQKNGYKHAERILSFQIGKAEEEMERLEAAVKKALRSDYGDSCIKWVHNEPILILNASYGRFVCGFFGNDPEWDVAILAATAKTLTKLSSLDGCLMGSYKEIPWAEAADELPVITGRVADIFINHRLPAIKKWEKWRKFNQGLELFFAT